jgi:uncharacterized protein (TIGR02118 family)
MTTLLALYRRPDGGEDAATAFEAAYATRHLPLVAGVPGLRALRVRRVRRRLMGDDDFTIATEMDFDDWEAAKAALSSPEMAAAGEILAEIAPGIVTLLVLEDAPDLAPSAVPGAER